MEVFKVFATLSLVDIISSPLQRIQSAMKAVDANVSTLSARMGKLAMSMAPVAVAAGAALGIFGMLATSTLATERAINELATLGVKNLTAVEETARQASNAMAGITKDQFISAAYDIKSGISTLSDEGVAAFTRLAAGAAQATKANVAEMTSLGATAYGIHKRMYAAMTDEDFGGMLYAGVAKSVQAFKTTGPAMNQAMANLGAAATQANRPLQEQLAVLGTLQNSMEASVAGTAYKSFFRDASRGFKELGIQATDASGRMRSMPDLLASLEAKLGPLDQVKLDSITKAFGSETGAMIQNLLGKSDELRSSIADVGEAMQGGQDFVTGMAKSVNKGLGPSLALLRQRTSNLSEELGKHLAPALTTLVDGVSYFALRLQELAKSPVTGFILKLVAGISTALVALTAFSAASWALTALGPVLAKVFLPLKVALVGLGWPIMAIIALIGLLYVAYKKNLGGIGDTVRRWGRNISLVFQGVSEACKSLTENVFTVKGALAEDIRSAGLEGVVTQIMRVIYRIKEFFSGVWDGLNFDGALAALQPAIQKIGELLNWLGGLFDSAFGVQLGMATSAARTFGNLVGQGLSFALQGMATSLSALVSVLDAVISSFRWVAAVLTGDWNTATEMARRVWDDLCGAFFSFVDLFTPAQWMKDAMSEAIDYLMSIDLAECGRAIINTLVSGVKSAGTALVGSVKDCFSSVRDMLPFSDAKTGPFSELTLSGMRLMTTLGEGVNKAAPGLFGTVQSALGEAGRGIDQWWKGLFQAPDSVNVPEPAIPAVPEASWESTDSGWGREERKREGGLTITIEHIDLPNVNDARSFVDELQNLVAEYGGGFA